MTTARERIARDIDAELGVQLADAGRFVNAYRALLDDDDVLPPALAALGVTPAAAALPAGDVTVDGDIAALRDELGAAQVTVEQLRKARSDDAREAAARLAEKDAEIVSLRARLQAAEPQPGSEAGRGLDDGPAVTAGRSQGDVQDEEIRANVLAALVANGGQWMSSGQVAETTGYHSTTCTRRLRLLLDDDAVDVRHNGKGGSHSKFCFGEPAIPADQDRRRREIRDAGLQGARRSVERGRENRDAVLAVLKAEPGKPLTPSRICGLSHFGKSTVYKALGEFREDESFGVRHDAVMGTYCYVGEVAAAAPALGVSTPPGPPPPAQPHGPRESALGGARPAPRSGQLSGRTRRALEAERRADVAAATAGPDQFEGRGTAELVEMCEERGIVVDDGTPDEDMRRALRARVERDRRAAEAQKAGKTQGDRERDATLDNEILRAMNGEPVGGRDLAKQILRNWSEVHVRLLELAKAGQVAVAGDGQWIKVGR